MRAGKRRWILCILGFVLSIGVGVGLAPAQDKPGDKGGKAGDKDGEVKPAPPERTSRNVETIFDYKVEIGLSEQQETDIRNAVEALVKQVRVQQAKLVIAADELEKLNNAEADLKDIRAKLMEIATLQVDMRYEDIAASRKINGMMSPAQLEKWKKIQERARTKGGK